MKKIKAGDDEPSSGNRQRLTKNKSQTGAWAILKQDMVNNLPKRELFNTVLASIAKAFADTNTKEISEDDRQYLVNELTENIIKYHPAIRLSEIPEAIALGVRGRYGEFYGLSVVTFLKFIEQYLLSAHRIAIVKERPADDAPRQPPDMQTQFETAKHNALYALQRKQERIDNAAIATAVYDFLDGIRLIRFTTREKQDMMADATRELIDELKYKLMVSPPAERTAIKRDIDAYNSVITEHKAVDHRLFTLVKRRAKKLALDAFLNNIILEDEDLSRLIEEKRKAFITQQIKPE